MINFPKGWYLIYTKPRHEKRVHSDLTELNIECFLPLARKWHTWHDRKKCIEEPLFPSYVFVYLEDLQGYYSGMDITGAMHYVRFGKDIARVSGEVVDSIKIAAGQVRDIEISGQLFEPGRKLVISKGALAGLACEMVEYNNKQKLLVRVDLLRRSLLLTVSDEYLMAM